MIPVELIDVVDAEGKIAEDVVPLVVMELPELPLPRELISVDHKVYYVHGRNYDIRNGKLVTARLMLERLEHLQARQALAQAQAESKILVPNGMGRRLN